MLRPIPAKILQSTATVYVCTGTDKYQNPTEAVYTVKRVHCQPTNEIRKTANNTDCTLRSILFVDARLSRPALAWDKLLKQAHDNEGDMRVVVTDKKGVEIDEFTVVGCDALRDETDRFHHWEIALI